MEQAKPVEKKKKSKVGLIVFAVVAFLIVGSAAATVIVHEAVFRRWDENSRDLALPHEDFVFMSGENELIGELYRGSGSDLLVICSGFHAVQEDYEPVIRAFLDEGYSVFTFDPTGVGKSDGASQRGFPQIVDDLGACLDFIEEKGSFGAGRLTVLGHSRGGYAALCLADRADAVIAVGAPATAMDGVLSGAYTKVGALAYLNYPNLFIWQCVKFGSEAVKRDAVKLAANSEASIFIVQGSKDEAVSKDRLSVFARRSELVLNSSIIIRLFDKGHVDVLYEDGEANPELMLQIFKFLDRAFDMRGAA